MSCYIQYVYSSLYIFIYCNSDANIIFCDCHLHLAVSACVGFCRGNTLMDICISLQVHETAESK